MDDNTTEFTLVSLQTHFKKILIASKLQNYDRVWQNLSQPDPQELPKSSTSPRSSHIHGIKVGSSCSSPLFYIATMNFVNEKLFLAVEKKEDLSWMEFSYDYDDSVGRYVECAICSEPYNDPVELSPCGHVFCAKDWIRWRDLKGEQCPVCAQAVADTISPGTTLTKLIKDLVIHCPFAEDGCDWKGGVLVLLICNVCFQGTKLTCCDTCGQNASPGAVPTTIVIVHF